ncbi:Eco29kI family restriction endonuclease [Burkholderia cenocepacia]|uniref:Eco29kI family restriction endonuclease n=1 Tax=Burkholderia cenocepacia TaxID=95486 RepID=UPI0024B81D12|nr:Eco29kI family restriction endonuclease [Burkholderia cenocepacia]MDI9694982.1 Eco29kI family restriction endonuclease [Burkholderia cenocepacia]
MVPFDPLAVENVGVTLAVELLEQPLLPLPPKTSFTGAGVYALYYTGNHSAYADLLSLDGAGGTRYPVYIGKAVRENAKQGFNPRPTTRAKIWERLGQHAESIRAVQDAGNDLDFRLEDFRCRHLVLNDAYITLAELVLITTFRPAWNGMGFGSKVVGGERMTSRPSLWDSLHPGRGGRPAGTAERGQLAQDKIKESIQKLSAGSNDPRLAKMLEKIRRFL